MCDNEQGWVNDDGYYVNSDGEVATNQGWVNTDEKNHYGTWYYVGDDGKVVKGWKYIDGDMYYFNYPGGSMAWSKAVGEWYLGSDGRRVTREGWVNTDEKNHYGTWYYVGPDGKVVKGWNRIDGKFYYFNYPGGSMTWQNTIGGFYLENSGKMVNGTGWLQDGLTGDWYYFSDGEAATGWKQDDDNKWYYLDDYGRMVTGWRYIGEEWYYFNPDGSMATGWVEDDSVWYFLGNNGAMERNSTEDGYHLNSSGKMVTGRGWIHVDSWWYYLKDDGRVATKWLYDQNNWYYLYPQGSMAKDVTIDGCYVNNEGKWITNNDGNQKWVRQGNEIYYFDSNGQVQIHGLVEDGKWHFYNSNDKEVNVDLGDSGKVEDDDTVENVAMCITPGGPVKVIGETVLKDVGKIAAKDFIKDVTKEATEETEKKAAKEVEDKVAKEAEEKTEQEVSKDATKGVGEAGPYSNLEDSASVGPGKNFTLAQKNKILQENRNRNGGVVKSDLSGQELVKPSKSQKGITPPQNEWQVDHIRPKDDGGSNSYSNAQVLSRKENRDKWNK